jgi:transposase InsO family protein
MLSIAGPVIPTSVKCFALEYANNHSLSHYYRPLVSPSVQLAEPKRTLTHTIVHISADNSFLDLPSGPSPRTSTFSLASAPEVQTLKYKPVAKKIKPVAATLPEEFRTTREIIGDPLTNMPRLSPHPPSFVPTGRYTAEARDIIDMNHPGDFLLPEERKLMHHFMMLFERGFAWDESQKGSFREDFFPPLKMPVVPHVPWALKNIPIPPGIYKEVVRILRDKIAAGTYEPSSSSYRSRWFTVLKKNGKLRIVHDLQPLNAITIRDSAVPPFTEQLAESFGGRGCYGLLDLFVGYDERPLHIDSRDLTTFPTPFGAYRLTSVPMGWSNAVPAFHTDVTFTLEPEIPHVTIPFLDDAGVKGPVTRYELPDGSYETIPENSGIRRFVWEHFQNLSRLVQRMIYVGCTWSGPKGILCVPEILIVGHLCTYDGRRADTSKIAKIAKWGPCRSLSEVRAFLGTAGLMRIFIKNYSAIARPLTLLTRKGIEFEFGPEQIEAQECLKEAIITSPAIRAIDYESDADVYLSVDTSIIAIGYILSQAIPDKPNARYPSRFGSMLLNERETNYSQPKLELYGLFRSLRAARLWIIGVRNLIVEVDAKYIKGMLNNPDIQPNATINRWIAGILLFDFKLVHVPGVTHGPDGLSRRPAQPDDDPEPPDDYEDWIDKSYGFMHIINPTSVSCGHRRALSLFTLDASPSSSPHRSAIAVHSSRDRVPLLVFNSELVAPLNFTPLPVDVSDVFVPRTPEADAADHRLNLVVQVLQSASRPASIVESEWRRLISYALRFFIHADNLWRKNAHGHHKIVVPPGRRLKLLSQAHDEVGHRGTYATRTHLVERFWWPHMNTDVKWFTDSCHVCQTRHLRQINIPPVVAMPGALFAKVYIDTFNMPRAGGFAYVVHARCSLSSYPEARMLRSETGRTLMDFIFQDILCRYGAVAELVTDNGTPYIAALDELKKKYGITHIRISGYNSKANGPVERKHWDFRQVMYKVVDGEASRWPQGFYPALWSERVTTTRTLGCSPYFAAHGIHPILPFDIDEATYLVPPPDTILTHEDLLARRGAEFAKRQSDLDGLRQRVHAARLAHMDRFSREHASKIHDYDFTPGSLVLVRNTRFEKSLNRKMRPRYIGPMIVISRNRGGAYILAEMNGAVLARPIGAFRVIPYFPRQTIALPPLEDLLDISTDELRRREQSTEPDEEFADSVPAEDIEP